MMTDSSLIDFAEAHQVSVRALPENGAAANCASTAELLAQAQPLFRGGLPPGVLRRVHQFIEEHLETTISLEELAAIARLSKSHFARAFRQSAGASPHDYLMQRRVQRAQELLVGTDLPLSEIAIACGFSDQSHFSRRFRERVGVTASRYRWLTR